MWGQGSKRVANDPDADAENSDVLPSLPSRKGHVSSQSVGAATTGELPSNFASTFDSSDVEFERAITNTPASKRSSRFARLKALTPRLLSGRQRRLSLPSSSYSAAPRLRSSLGTARCSSARDAQGLDRQAIKDVAEHHGWCVVDVPEAGSAPPNLPQGDQAVLILATTDRLQEAQLLVSDCKLRVEPIAPSKLPPAAPIAVLLKDCLNDDPSDLPRLLEAQVALLDGGADDVTTNATTEQALFVSLPMCLMRSRAKKAAIRDAAAQVDQFKDDLFRYSESTLGSDFMTLPGFSRAGSWRAPERVPEKHSSKGSGGAQKVETSECGVNTEIAMDGFDYKCTRCQKPPLPALPEIAREDVALEAYKGKRRRQRSMSRGRSEAAGSGARERSSSASSCSSSGAQLRTYEGNEFDGVWMAVYADGNEEEPDYFNDWLRLLEVVGPQVRLGDGSDALVLVDAEGHCSIGGGRIRLDQHKRLCRYGHSGVVVTFELIPPENLEECAFEA